MQVKMISKFPVLKFLLKFFLVYLIGFGLFSLPFVKKLVSSVFIQSSETVISAALSDAYFQFGNDPALPDKKYRVKILFETQDHIDKAKAEARQQGLAQITLRFKNFFIFLTEFIVLPILFLSALFFATPKPIKVKSVAWLWGLLLLQVYFFLKLFFITLHYIQLNQLPIYEMGEFGVNTIEKIQIGFNNVGSSILYIVLVWIFLMFNSNDWKKLIAKFG